MQICNCTKSPLGCLRQYMRPTSDLHLRNFDVKTATRSNATRQYHDVRLYSHLQQYLGFTDNQDLRCYLRLYPRLANRRSAVQNWNWHLWFGVWVWLNDFLRNLCDILPPKCIIPNVLSRNSQSVVGGGDFQVPLYNFLDASFIKFEWESKNVRSNRTGISVFEINRK